MSGVVFFYPDESTEGMCRKIGSCMEYADMVRYYQIGANAVDAATQIAAIMDNMLPTVSVACLTGVFENPDVAVRIVRQIARPLTNDLFGLIVTHTSWDAVRDLDGISKAAFVASLKRPNEVWNMGTLPPLHPFLGIVENPLYRPMRQIASLLNRAIDTVLHTPLYLAH